MGTNLGTNKDSSAVKDSNLSNEINKRRTFAIILHLNTGEVRSDGAEGIACWFIDTDYNEDSFFVRHAYFLGANDPYKSLKTTLKAEISEDAWATLIVIPHDLSKSPSRAVLR